MLSIFVAGLGLSGLALFFVAGSLAAHEQRKLTKRINELARPAFESGDATIELSAETVAYFRKMMGR